MKKLLLTFLIATASYAQEAPVPPEIRESSYVVDHRNIHIAESGSPDRMQIVFIHGTPGSWRAFRGYLSDKRLLNRFHMVALDRAGFGQSTSGGIETSLAKQAELIAPLLVDHREKTIVVGHSLGGTIAYQVAVDYPDLIDGLIAISASIDPDLGGPRWYNKLANLGLIRWLVPSDLQLANDEIMPLHEELSALTPRLGTIAIPVILIHGEVDKLVSPRNVAFAETHLRSVTVTVMREPDQGHFLLWEKPSVIVDAILQMGRNIDASQTSINETSTSSQTDSQKEG